MIFYICLAVFIIFIVLTVFTYRECWDADFICVGGMLISGVITAILTFAVISANVGTDAERAKLQQENAALIYKAEVSSIRDEFGLLNKEYIDEIVEWNIKLAAAKEYSHNIWTYNLYSDVYDDFDFIDINNLAVREEY